MRKVLFLISSDPRTSHRPAEALRIAAGTRTWQRVSVNVCLTGPATLMLGDRIEDFRDEDQITSCLLMLRQPGSPVFVFGAPDAKIAAPGIECIDLKGLAALAMRHHLVARF